MADNDKLLVRVYDVKFGDFVYVRVPDGGSGFHILIDCGTEKSGHPDKFPPFKAAFEHMRSQLPAEGADKRLDLLVVTHPHEDHIKGFDPKWFKGILIKRIWLSAFMRLNHPQAVGAHALQALAERSAYALSNRTGLSLGPGLRALLMKSIGNKGALNALRQGLASQSQIDPSYPLYVARDAVASADQVHSQEAVDSSGYGVKFEDGTTCFRDFPDQQTRLRVLAPEWDIDGWYLGKDLPEVEHYAPLLSMHEGAGTAAPAGGPKPVTIPHNIGAFDFRRLRNRMFYAGLAFSHADKTLKNNTSVVLLLEWRGRRLLFTGDAEWKGREVEEGKRNYCWDVMLNIPQVNAALVKPLHYLKVGHHGSLNGSPFVLPKDREVRVGQPTLDQMLPENVPDESKAYVVVSTDTGEHGDVNEVPYAPLLWELGCRARNAQKYAEEGHKYGYLAGKPQPQRTDKEADKPGAELPHRVDILLEAAPGWDP